MPEIDELLPCPFCGTIDLEIFQELVIHKISRNPHIKCPLSGYGINLSGWNIRPSPESQKCYCDGSFGTTFCVLHNKPVKRELKTFPIFETPIEKFMGYSLDQLTKAIHWCKQHGFNIENDPKELRKPWVMSESQCNHISGGLGACPKCGTPYDKIESQSEHKCKNCGSNDVETDKGILAICQDCWIQHFPIKECLCPKDEMCDCGFNHKLDIKSQSGKMDKVKIVKQLYDIYHSAKYPTKDDMINGIADYILSLPVSNGQLSADADAIYKDLYHRTFLAKHFKNDEIARDVIRSISNRIASKIGSDGQLVPLNIKKLIECLKEYNCQGTIYEDDSGVSLVDMLTPDGDDISTGLEEIELLADHICVEFGTPKVTVPSVHDLWVQIRALKSGGNNPSDEDIAIAIHSMIVGGKV